MENSVIQNFKDFLKTKNFTVTGEKHEISAVYDKKKITFSFNDDFGYSIHYYIGDKMCDCKVFNIEMAEEFEAKYKLLFVEDIEDKTTVEDAEKRVKNLESNKKTMEKLINEFYKIKFIFKLDKHYSGMDGEFTNIEDMLDTLDEKY
ncbi:hypothetical protein [Clostridium estertheticum]|uniref:hypothetical protein n=1 Tax=Clostridium estertheticum TaxID=238834 RepID=UPI001C7DAE7A|nr:hypothetical protein [Clostridium estertheticum]MBX4268904.1 hypothetical protein [Clostridium estertheticum]WLC78903.1 hypothetical protein KTC98_17160 [Clostridium estertheticum]